MEPTFHHGDLALANRLAYVGGEPARGDVVAVRLRESGRGIFYLKRVVGLPGERIGFSHGQLMVNGSLVEEPYLVYPTDWEMPPVLCASDEYFLVGDNRSMPIEDHSFGRIRRSLILGKVIF
jgi:signal peptidase I